RGGREMTGKAPPRVSHLILPRPGVRGSRFGVIASEKRLSSTFALITGCSCPDPQRRGQPRAFGNPLGNRGFPKTPLDNPVGAELSAPRAAAPVARFRANTPRAKARAAPRKRAKVELRDGFKKVSGTLKAR